MGRSLKNLRRGKGGGGKMPVNQGVGTKGTSSSLGKSTASKIYGASKKV